MKHASTTPSVARFSRRSALWAILLAPAFVLVQPATGRAATGREHQLKAAVVYNFTKFVVWPPGAFSSPDAPFVIGTVGDGPSAEELQRIVVGRRVDGRAYEVRKVASAADARTVHLLYFDQAADALAVELVAAVGTSPVLLVGDGEGFLDRGGVVQLLVANDKIAFDIDVSRAHDLGLQISAQLQKLARRVRRDR